MKPSERQQEIMVRLRALQSELSVDELADQFKVSPLTIRRDLEQLERAGAIVRTHGGSVLRTAVESDYHQRVALNFELKQAIGKAAAQEVKSGEMILINDGSTPFHLACHLGEKGSLSVYTNSMAVVSELSRFPSIRIYVLGGEYNSAMHFMGGSITEQLIEGLLFDWVFLGADAIDSNGHCLVADPPWRVSPRSCCAAGGEESCWRTTPRWERLVMRHRAAFRPGCVVHHPRHQRDSADQVPKTDQCLSRQDMIAHQLLSTV